MRARDVLYQLRQTPFRAIRLHLTNGSVFEITHPEVAIVGRSTIGLPLPENGDGERHAVIALLHIIWMETPA